MGLSTTTLTLITFAVLFTVIQSKDIIRNKRRMYAMCPPKFQRIGSECYAISDQQANWLEAHFQCKDKNSKLAEPNSRSDKKLRAFFQKMDHDTDEIWIGATYDWNINVWQWSISGKNLTYDAFSRLDPESRKSLEYNCAVLNPSLKYRWSARPCVDKHRYICQHKMPKVSEKNRFKVYSRWNQTYPNQLANEVEMEVVATESKDGKRITRRLKPLDSSENYPMPPRRSPESTKARRRPHVPPKETNNEINVQFIPNYLTNEINEGVSFKPPTPATMFPLTMDFIPADILDNRNLQAAQPYMDTTTTLRPRNPTNAPSNDNETVTPTRPRTRPPGKRVRTKFDDIIEEKRKLERNQKRAEHRRRKQERMRRRQEEERKKHEQERKKQEAERKREEEDQRKSQEEERKKQQQLEITNLKLRQAEEEKEKEAALLERQKLEDKLRKSKEEQERQEREEAILKEQREEEEERVSKQRLHEQKRLQLEYEERLKKQQTERERILEEEKQKAEENRRRIEQEQAARQAELKRLQEEDEKRLELQRIEIERKRHEKELARLEEENQKRIAAQKAREEEIRRREEALAADLAEEKRLQEELRQQEERDRLLHEQELQNEIEEKKRKEEAERLEVERKEEIRKKKYQERLAKEAKKLEEQKKLEETARLEEEKRRQNKEKIRKYAERISRLSPEMQALFLKARKERKRNKMNSDNEASIPERK